MVLVVCYIWCINEENMEIQAPNNNQCRVRLLREGDHQVVDIPREFELPGDEAILRREGKRLIIEAAPVGSLLSFLESCEPLDVDFPDIDDLASVAEIDL